MPPPSRELHPEPAPRRHSGNVRFIGHFSSRGAMDSNWVTIDGRLHCTGATLICEHLTPENPRDRPWRHTRPLTPKIGQSPRAWSQAGTGTNHVRRHTAAAAG